MQSALTHTLTHPSLPPSLSLFSFTHTRFFLSLQRSLSLPSLHLYPSSFRSRTAALHFGNGFPRIRQLFPQSLSSLPPRVARRRRSSVYSGERDDERRAGWERELRGQDYRTVRFRGPLGLNRLPVSASLQEVSVSSPPSPRLLSLCAGDQRQAPRSNRLKRHLCLCGHS